MMLVMHVRCELIPVAMMLLDGSAIYSFDHVGFDTFVHRRRNMATCCRRPPEKKIPGGGNINR